jgi:ABC-type Na+ efflux pump permease subunit
MIAALTDPERWSPAAVPAAAGLLAAGVAVGGTPGVALAAAGGLLLVACCVSRRDGFLLAGPFPWWELVRHSRRTRVHLWRSLVAFATCAPVGVLYYLMTAAPEDLAVGREKACQVATLGFLFVGWHLFLMAFSLVSTFLSYAVAEDREAKRLDFVLATDLRGRELVIGKAASRLVAALGYPLAALPAVAALPLLFGVDVALLVYAAGYAAVTLFTVGGASVLGSVVSGSKKAAGSWSAAILAPYLVLTAVLHWLKAYPAVWFFPGSPTDRPRVSVGDLVEAASAGNPFVRATGWAATVGSGDLTPVAADFPGYAAFHLAAGVLLFAAAALVRPVAGRAGGGATAGRPAVGDRPVLWKEAYCHPTASPAERSRVGRIAFVVLVVVPAAVFALSAVVDYGPYWSAAVKLAGAYPLFFAWMTIILAGRYALESVPRERQRDTLTTLLTTPLDADDIARQKLLGAVLLLRWVVLGELIVGAGAIVAGAVPWWAFLGVLAVQGVFVLQAAAVGGWVGATAPTVEAAGRRFGLWFAAAAVLPMGVGGLLTLAWWPLRFLAVGLAGPVSLLAAGNPSAAPAGELPYWAAGLAAGLAVHAAIGWAAWRGAVRRFAAVCDPARDDGPLLTARADG